jgi:hypothetical protein
LLRYDMRDLGADRGLLAFTLDPHAVSAQSGVAGIDQSCAQPRNHAPQHQRSADGS